MKDNLRKEIELPEGVSVDLVLSLLKVKGAKGETERDFIHPKVKISVEDNKVILDAPNATKREKTILGSFSAHIKNMIKGVQEPFEYRLKICSGHFPMNVSVNNNELIIKNLFGESVPRKVQLLNNVDVKVNGTEIVILSTNKETAGQMAAKIENLCKITDRDIRIFQDGCYITYKGGKDLI